MSTRYPIRPATTADAPALAKLIAGLPELSARFVDRSPDPAPALAACLADDSHSIWVADDPAGDGLAGYLAVHWVPFLLLAGPEGYISELFVALVARGSGLGSRLLATAEAAARERGCERLSLLNMRNRASYQRGFYSARGWTERPDAANFIRRLD